MVWSFWRGNLLITLLLLVFRVTFSNLSTLKEYNKLTIKPKSNVLMITTRRKGACSTLFGDYIISLSLKNKMDYCHNNGYDLKFFTRIIDMDLQDHWNKVGYLAKIVGNPSYASYEWIIWLDNDTLFMEMNKKIDFSSYEGHDIVVGGCKEELSKEFVDVWKGVNTGILYFRNNETSAEFIKKWKEFGMLPIEKQNSMAKEANLLNYEAVQDQKGFTYLYVYQPSLTNNRKKIFIEDFFNINGYWEKYIEWDKPQPFIKHWAGCSFCDVRDVEQTQLCYEDIVKNAEEKFYE